jgi:integrase
MPREVSAIRREHVEAYIEDILTRWTPATALNRYQGLRQFFRFLVEDGEISKSPMARMTPHKVPEAPPPVLTDDEGSLRRAFWSRSWRSRLHGSLRTGTNKTMRNGRPVCCGREIDRGVCALGSLSSAYQSGLRWSAGVARWRRQVVRQTCLSRYMTERSRTAARPSSD